MKNAICTKFDIVADEQQQTTTTLFFYIVMLANKVKQKV